MTDEAEAIKIANESGFPLQVAVGHLVKATTSQHGWSVMYTEHSWVNEHDEQSGFIDIVLKNREMRLVIECKRTKATWVFIPGDGVAEPRRRAKAWVVRDYPTQILLFGWREL